MDPLGVEELLPPEVGAGGGGGECSSLNVEEGRRCGGGGFSVDAVEWFLLKVAILCWLIVDPGS